MDSAVILSEAARSDKGFRAHRHPEEGGSQRSLRSNSDDAALAEHPRSLGSRAQCGWRAYNAASGPRGHRPRGQRRRGGTATPVEFAVGGVNATARPSPLRGTDLGGNSGKLGALPRCTRPQCDEGDVAADTGPGLPADPC